MLFACHPKILHKRCLLFLLGVQMTPRETEINAYAEFWGDKRRVLWYVMVFSGVVNKEKWPESLDRLCVAWKYTWHEHSVMSCNAINPMVFIRGNTTLDTSYDTSRSDYPTMGLWRICLPLSLNFIAFAFLWWKHRKALKAKPAVFKKIGHVAGLFIYPVKSCRGISLEASNCLIEGLQNDRYSAIF